MIKLTNAEYDEIENIANGYFSLNNMNQISETYTLLKDKLDNSFYRIGLWNENEIIKSELELGNVIINNDILTCIYDNKIHNYKIIKRKGEVGEYAYIINASNNIPFNKKYIGRCFKIGKTPSNEELEYVQDHVVVNLEDGKAGWCLYDDQYIIIKEI